MATNYLTFEDAVAIHGQQIERFGASSGIRDAGLIEAALQRPQTGYYDDIIEEAAALWESLTMNHGFVDGNKRIGFACMHVFLRMNGLQLRTDSAQAAHFVLHHLEAGTFEKRALTEWLRKHVAKE